MREILALFKNPEICIEEMITGKSSRTILKGIINIAQIALLTGLIGALGIKSFLPYLIELLSGMGLALHSGLLQIGDVNLGLLLIILAFITALIIVLGAILHALIMAALLFIIRFLVGGTATFKELFLITTFSQVIMAAVILADVIVFIIISIASTSTISDVILSIMTLFQFWYLVFILVGFNVANRVSFFRSIVAVLLMQSILWGIYYMLFIQFMWF